MLEFDDPKILMTLCAAALLVGGCGRLADYDGREGFGTYGSGNDGEDNADLGEQPGSGGAISESCYDGVLDPGELCQVQAPDLDAGIDPCSLSIADFDEDGRLDVAVPNSDFDGLSGGTYEANVLRGHGNGNFSSNQAWDAGARLPVGLAVGDFDGDGHVDIATANWEAERAVVLRNQGGGGSMGFSTPDEISVGSIANSITAADIDGDGRDDLIVNTNDGIALLRGEPGGVSWYATLDVGGGMSQHADLADLDHDGNLDLVAAVSGDFGVSNRLIIFHGAGDGGFPERVEHELDGMPWWVEIGELNMDGDLDVAVAQYEANKVAMFVGNGIGGYSARHEFDVCAGPQSVAIGDMNNDGASDLVVGCHDADTVQLWLQIEDGEFDLVRWWATGDTPVSVQVADFNLDGQLDVAWANQLGNTIGRVISHV